MTGRAFLVALAFASFLAACSGREGENDGGGRQESSGFDANVQLSPLCPEFVAYLLLPHDVDPDTWADVSVRVRDADDATDRLVFSWTATAGAFSNPRLADTQYACQGAGPQLMTVRVRDPRGCERQLVFDVSCLEDSN